MAVPFQYTHAPAHQSTHSTWVDPAHRQPECSSARLSRPTNKQPSPPLSAPFAPLHPFAPDPAAVPSSSSNGRKGVSPPATPPPSTATAQWWRWRAPTRWPGNLPRSCLTSPSRPWTWDPQVSGSSPASPPPHSCRRGGGRGRRPPASARLRPHRLPPGGRPRTLCCRRRCLRWGNRSQSSHLPRRRPPHNPTPRSRRLLHGQGLGLVQGRWRWRRRARGDTTLQCGRQGARGEEQQGQWAAEGLGGSQGRGARVGRLSRGCR